MPSARLLEIDNGHLWVSYGLLGIITVVDRFFELKPISVSDRAENVIVLVEFGIEVV